MTMLTESQYQAIKARNRAEKTSKIKQAGKSGVLKSSIDRRRKAANAARDQGQFGNGGHNRSGNYDY